MQRSSVLLGSVLAVSCFMATGCGGSSKEDVETGARSDQDTSADSSTGGPATASHGSGQGSSTTTPDPQTDQTPDITTTQETSSQTTTTTTSNEEETTTEPAESIDCETLNHQGNDVGQVPMKMTFRDFEGKEIDLHKLCQKPVLILSGSGISQDYLNDAKAADALLEKHYSGGEVKVVYMFSARKGDRGISVAQYISEINTWGTGDNAGIGDHGVAIDDYKRDALKHYFGSDVPETESRRMMLLKPGFEVVQVLGPDQIDSQKFKEKLDAIIAGDPLPKDPSP